MLMAQHQQLYELKCKAWFLEGNKTPECGKAFEAGVAMLKVKTDNSSDESSFANEKHKLNVRNNPALDTKGSGTRQN